MKWPSRAATIMIVVLCLPLPLSVCWAAFALHSCVLFWLLTRPGMRR